MPNAIEKIVDTYDRLNDRQALEVLRLHRQRLALDLKARTGYDSLPLLQVEDEIAIIVAAGLERPGSVPMTERAE
jgi:hypothetical protein